MLLTEVVHLKCVAQFNIHDLVHYNFDCRCYGRYFKVLVDFGLTNPWPSYL